MVIVFSKIPVHSPRISEQITLKRGEDHREFSAYTVAYCDKLKNFTYFSLDNPTGEGKDTNSYLLRK